MAKELLGSLELNRIYQRDCLSDGGMALIPDKSIDMILCDLPYGVTARNKWDSVLPFEELWAHYERVIKDNGAIVLTAQQPFSTLLAHSNLKIFKYEMIWKKLSGKTGHLNAKRMPLREHESVLVFYKKQPTYNPQMVGDEKRVIRRGKNKKEQTNYGDFSNIKQSTYEGYFPSSILEFQIVSSSERVHPTEKPTKLFEWLIKTFTNEGDIVLDNCMGSGTTAVASLNTNRRFIGFETEPAYIEIANKRIDDLR
jgi:site-specific DNA-methyltransferase (adenine-specific)